MNECMEAQLSISSASDWIKARFLSLSAVGIWGPANSAFAPAPHPALAPFTWFSEKALVFVRASLALHKMRNSERRNSFWNGARNHTTDFLRKRDERGKNGKAQSGVSPSWSTGWNRSPQILIICGTESFANGHWTEAEFHETKGKRLA